MKNEMFIARIDELKIRLAILNNRLTMGLSSPRIRDLKIEIYETEELLRLNQCMLYSNINLYYGTATIQ
jgi:hypothetical protein